MLLQYSAKITLVEKYARGFVPVGRHLMGPATSSAAPALVLCVQLRLVLKIGALQLPYFHSKFLLSQRIRS